MEGITLFRIAEVFNSIWGFGDNSHRCVQLSLGHRESPQLAQPVPAVTEEIIEDIDCGAVYSISLPRWNVFLVSPTNTEKTGPGSSHNDQD